METGLKGKNALVTGGSRGIGRAVALGLAREGANVAISYRSSREAAEETCDALRALGVEAMAVQADNSSFEATKALVERLKAWGGIHVLVNNAGITRDGLLARMSPEDWAAVIDTNLSGVFNVTRAAIMGMMRQRWGRIITLSSISAQLGMAGQTNYSAAKAGLIGFSKALAREVAARNITVNVVAPGPTDTEMIRSIPEKIMKAQIDMIPLGRVADPAEVADAVVFLASDRASYITGQVLGVNGGMAM